MPAFELFGTGGCPFTTEMRDWLDWKGHDFAEHDVEADPAALEKMLRLTGGERTVPVLVQDGKVVQIGWQGRGCVVSAPQK